MKPSESNTSYISIYLGIKSSHFAAVCGACVRAYVRVCYLLFIKKRPPLTAFRVRSCTL